MTVTNALVGSGNDVINAAGVTTISHKVIISGGDGSDTITGGRGSDTLDGGEGNDRLIATGTTRLVVRLDVNAGLDQTSGDTDIVRNFENFNGAGMTAGLAITGSRDANILVGGSSNDIIDVKGGADTISGGAGDDRISMWEWNVSLNGGSGNDTLVFGRSWSVVIDLSAANQNVEGITKLTGSENFDGSLATGDITISGNSAANVLIGGLGNDMFGVGAGDTVFGGDGHDTVLINTAGSPVLHLHGGDGEDQIVLPSAYDFRKSDVTGFEYLTITAPTQVTFTAAQWNQFTKVKASDTTIGATLNIVLTTAGSLDATIADGSGGNNHYNITGSAGNDTIRSAANSISTIHAGDGDDVIIPRGGSPYASIDKIYGEAGNDRIEFVWSSNEENAPVLMAEPVMTPLLLGGLLRLLTSGKPLAPIRTQIRVFMHLSETSKTSTGREVILSSPPWEAAATHADRRPATRLPHGPRRR